MLQSQFNNKENPKSPWANSLRKIGIVIMIITALIGFIIGAVCGFNTMPFIGDDFPDAFLCGAVGLLLGGIAGVIAMAVVMYFSELGINMRKAAENTQAVKDTKLSEADELKKYKDLLDTGLITQEEFDQKKKELLYL